jgi:hypothetical protein
MISGYDNDGDYMEVEYFTNYNRDKEEFTVDELDEIEGINNFENFENFENFKNKTNSVLKNKDKKKDKKKVINEKGKKKPISKKNIKNIETKKNEKKNIVNNFKSSKLNDELNDELNDKLNDELNNELNNELEEDILGEEDILEEDILDNQTSDNDLNDIELAESELEEQLDIDNESNVVEGFSNYKEGFLGHIREEQKTNNLMCKVILISLLFYLISHDTCKKMLKKTKSKFFKIIDFTLYSTIIFFIITYLILVIF